MPNVPALREIHDLQIWFDAIINYYFGVVIRVTIIISLVVIVARINANVNSYFINFGHVMVVVISNGERMQG